MAEGIHADYGGWLTARQVRFGIVIEYLEDRGIGW